jgi:hypothetical protein
MTRPLIGARFLLCSNLHQVDSLYACPHDTPGSPPTQPAAAGPIARPGSRLHWGFSDPL